MEDGHRQLLRRNRVRLVTTLQVEDIWDPLVERGVFSSDMVQEIQIAGTRRDQARKLLVDLETRGSQAFSLFLLCLKDTGQHKLADLLQENGGSCEITAAQIAPTPIPIYPTPIPIYPTPIPKPAEKKRIADQTPKFFDIEKDYPMYFDPCGYCLIINNVEFLKSSNLSDRTGSNIDREKLDLRMRSLHFEVVVKNNLKGAEIHQELRDLAARDHSKRDCCLVVILSHGCETRHMQFPGGVYGTDGVAIPVERIVHYFNGSNSPSLRGKPKLFFIQACGGDQKDRGYSVDSGDPPSNHDAQTLQSDATAVRPDEGDRDETDAMVSLPTYSDILVSYSTCPGFVSWRDKISGTWYVEVLDKVLEENDGTLDLQTMLVMVADRVSPKGSYKQIPGFFNFLRKRFYFKTC
ncbi:caspase-9 [Mixophyes fleayi]|uniref:caspase-9 n=1 Tax=Mixophyes fleayi TaxID=3061075 RepID=UPI003F4DFE31